MPKFRRRALLGVAAFLLADDHAGLAIESRQATDDRQVVCIRPVTVQFHEVGEQIGHVVERVGALRVARDLRHLPGCQVRVDVLGQLLAFLVQPVDLVGDVDCRLVLHVAQLFDLGIELGNRLLEVEEVAFAHAFSLLNIPPAADRGCARDTRWPRT